MALMAASLSVWVGGLTGTAIPPEWGAIVAGVIVEVFAFATFRKFRGSVKRQCIFAVAGLLAALVPVFVVGLTGAAIPPEVAATLGGLLAAVVVFAGYRAAFAARPRSGKERRDARSEV